MQQSSIDERSQDRDPSKSRDIRSASLSPENFRSRTLTPAKNLPSPIRPNNDSAPLATIPAYIVDSDEPATTDRDNGDSGDELSDSGSSTPKASQHPQSLTSIYRPFDRPKPPPGRHRRGNQSVSSSSTPKPEVHQEQKVIDDMSNILQLGNARNQEDLGFGGDIISERSRQLTPARSLRREGRKACDYYDDDDYDEDSHEEVVKLRKEGEDDAIGRDLGSGLGFRKLLERF
ncbi:hypothetical protein TSTA_059520 [Talaromyces stipitatus ATCC 10500]|uniref:Uncharacterized protein n=1 Tax=Talaromyces stipitatus (strain ATCC 10500 / CBS 375.48 / QM 6759 / NRRL 1006) TaxID=441959 RepID=B8MQP2_TALSN|nr:uncharacterized protein TSTA_059520 [Talaromyces stipitatus ATCC 10500]EED13465.1 hypothetical protein TSTA_059520 [Talaromyces stipitatus ATCC 10500]